MRKTLKRNEIKCVFDKHIVTTDGFIYFYENNFIKSIFDENRRILWYYSAEGLFHNVNGPAIIGMGDEGSYWLRGIPYSYENWCKKAKEYA